MAVPDNNTLPPDGLYQDYWEFTLKENPTFATYLGDHRYDNWLEASLRSLRKSASMVQEISRGAHELQEANEWRGSPKL